ncbi:MAG: hypothetical protein H7A10_08455 [Oceanospirillaceae bacterium]|nr:hypothetical protein [Oceanospirillaceae bacterium]
MFSRYLGRRLAFWMLLLTLLLQGLYIAYRYAVDLPAARKQALAQVESVIHSIQPSAAVTVYQYNERVGSQLLGVFSSVPAIQGAWLEDERGEILSGYINNDIQLSDDSMGKKFELNYDGIRVGTLLIELDMSVINAEAHAQLRSLIYASLLTGLLSTLFIILLVRRLVTRPLEVLADDVAGINVQDPQPARLHHKILHRKDEVGQLQRAISDLVAALAASTAAQALALAELSHLNANLEGLVEERTRDLARETDKAQVANHAKTEFIAMVTHELRTPLNSILGFTDVLSRQGLEGRSAECVQTIRRSGQHLLQLINDIIEYVELEHKPLLNQPFSVHDLRAGLLSRYQGKTSHVQFELAEVQHIPVLIGDARRLEMLCRQLLDNALKFTEQGSVQMQMAYDAATCMLLVRISDTGCGIDLAHLDDLLAVFNLGTGVMTRREGGNGMGLAIVQRIVQRWGGSLDFAANSPRGTVVSVRLPCQCIR